MLFDTVTVGERIYARDIHVCSSGIIFIILIFDSSISHSRATHFISCTPPPPAFTFRDVMNGGGGGGGSDVHPPPPPLSPQHLETEDFMRLSRDFAKCLIAAPQGGIIASTAPGLSWMIDENGDIMKMSLSPLAAAEVSAAAGSNFEAHETSALTFEQHQVMRLRARMQYTHQQTHVHAHAHAHARRHAHTHAHAHSHTHTFTHTLTHTLAHSLSHLHTRTHAHAHTQTHTHTHAHTRIHRHANRQANTNTHARFVSCYVTVVQHQINDALDRLRGGGWYCNGQEMREGEGEVVGEGKGHKIEGGRTLGFSIHSILAGEGIKRCTSLSSAPSPASSSPASSSSSSSSSSHHHYYCHHYHQHHYHIHNSLSLASFSNLPPPLFYPTIVYKGRHHHHHHHQIQKQS